ncbi:TPA: hypothetical protein ACNV6G_005339 [Raoultella ornithinolytica]|uniref:hypothetical protein n=1 Tax=Raoultella TaxID=160674 RepID=UPI001F5050BD|nr:hypothetical protein [Raoultella sp. HC6]HEC2580377.1 hypothetical protein [Raoultella ornithinolytica]HEC2587863.1 hypothetical protein [Raoultella ornithinolytica]HEC2621080.1 hypothetical protein [Raoultella ornithinolytica]
MCQALILKYSNADPEQMLGQLPIEEVIDALKDRLRNEVIEEVRCEFKDEIGQLEYELENSTDFESEAESWECDANDLYRAIEKALTEGWEEAKLTLQRALQDSQAG